MHMRSQRVQVELPAHTVELLCTTSVVLLHDDRTEFYLMCVGLTIASGALLASCSPSLYVQSVEASGLVPILNQLRKPYTHEVSGYLISRRVLV